MRSRPNPNRLRAAPPLLTIRVAPLVARSFGSYVWVIIFALKPVIVGTMIAYDLLENRPDGSGQEGRTWTQFDAKGQPGEQEYQDDEVAA